jgi:hypothetical protein
MNTQQITRNLSANHPLLNRIGAKPGIYEITIDKYNKVFIVIEQSSGKEWRIPIDMGLVSAILNASIEGNKNWRRDGDYEWQQKTNPKPDGNRTITVRRFGQTTNYPHTNFDYNPKTGEATYNHYSLSKSKHYAVPEIEKVVHTAIASLKDMGVL